MVKVLCIGQYNAEGKFHNEQWRCFIDTFLEDKSNLLLNREMLEENIRLCYKGKADIDEALQEECWKPLGE